MVIDGREEDRTAAVVMAGLGMICGVLAIIFSIAAVAYAHSKVPQIPVAADTQVVEREIANFDGYKCEKIGSDIDMLQPSGYWVGMTLECWKLKIPINQWCNTHRDDPGCIERGYKWAE